MDLQDVGKYLYRYNVLKKNNHLAAAEEEKEKIEHKVLKGHICNVKYVWRSEHGEHTCDECESMDGEEFEPYEDIPPKPHPNCRCEVEVYECPYEQEYSTDEDDDETQSKKPKEDKDKVPPNTQPLSQKWIMPCNGPIVGQYGEQRRTHVHNGIDIAVPVGTPIKAIADGTVVVTGPVNGYGYWVGINHGLVNGIKVSSEYGHLSKWVVNNGQHVKQGQIIAYSGNTGYSQGPHLHLTIRHGNPGKGGGIAVNPWEYIGN